MKNKIIRKLCVYLLIGLIFSSSVVLSYQKANSCEAVSIGAEIATAVLLLGVGLYGSYYVAQPENREELKETFTNYKNLAVEGAKNSYEFNKKLFNDFCSYAQSNGGGSASVYTAGGQTYTVDQMQAEGFPDFEKWDSEMKKQSEKPKPSLWDAMSFGLDLVSFLSSFFKDDPNGYFPDDSNKQRYFTGDDGYINRETGDAFIYLYSDLGVYRRSDNYYPDTYYRLEHIKNYGENTTFRAAIFLVPVKVSGDSLKYDLPGGNVEYKWYRYKVDARAVYGHDGSTRTDYLSNITGGFIQYNRTQGNVERVDATGSGYFRSSYSCRFSDPHDASSYVVTEWDFFSTNLPVFRTKEEADNYIATGDYNGCLNLPPALPTVTPKPDTYPESTALDIYLNHYKSGGYTVDAVVNTNYNIGNNWDGSTTNLTYILNGNTTTPTPEPTNTPKPTKIAPSGDSNNYTNYNFFVDLSNFLQPIKDAIESILDFLLKIFGFFAIDMDAISDEISGVSIAPVSDFQNILQRMNRLKDAFSDDIEDVEEEQSVESVAVYGSSENISGDEVKTDTTRSRGIVYPVIKMKCPAVIAPYLDKDSYVLEGNTKYIVLINFKDYALYLVRARGFMKVALWIGMFFYLLKQFRIVFSIT